MTARIQTSLRFKLTLFVAAIVVLTAGALSVASYVFARRILRAQIHDRLSVVANDRQKLLFGYVQQQQERVALVASRTRLRQLLEQFGASQLDAETFHAETRRILLDAQGSSPGLLAIWITDLNGRCITATGDEYLGKDFASTPEFVDGRKAARLRLVHDDEGRERALLAAPARGTNNRVVGVVMMRADAEPIMDLLADRAGLGETGVVLLGMRTDEKIQYLLVPDAGTQSFDVPLSQAPTMVAATEGRSGFQQTIDWRGVPVLAAYRPVGYDNWGLVTKMDVAEAYAPIAWLRRLFITVESVVFVVGLLGSYGLARRFTRPILHLAKMAESIAAGGLEARVVVESNDEVGKLGESFNRMAEELAHSYAILEDRVKERTAELRASQEQTRLIMETAHEAFVAMDANSQIIDWNTAAERTFGWSREEILGQRLTQTIMPARYCEAHEKGLRRFLATGDSPILNKRLEMSALRRDGQEFPVELTIAPVRVGDHFVFNAFLHDISERKQREQALREAEAKYRQLVEQLPAITYIAEFGPEGRWLYVSPQVEALLGFSAAEWMNQPDLWINQLHADDRERVLCEEAASRETRESFRSEYRLLTRDGRVLWVRDTATVVLDAAGQLQYLHGVMLDITERKRAEEELDRYFTLSLDLFCMADYRGNFKRLNPAWEQVLGYKLEELVAQPFLNFVHPDDRPATVAEFEKILKGGRALHFENRYRCKNGAYKWLQWTAIPEPEQQIIHAVARDITEHKRAQELLAGFADALNRKNMDMQEDLKMAREIQQAFIPEHYPVLPRHAAPGKSALRFVHLYEPAATLGGDFFNVFALSDTQVGVFICDVMGHGIRAALVTAIVRGVLEELRPFATDPGQFLTEINLGLIKNLKLATTTIFASAFYLVIDAATGEMLCANAGHPSPFWLRRDAGTVQLLPESDQARGPALGLMSETEYPTLCQRLGATDAVLLFTDGLYEVDDAEGNQFGLARLREEVQKRIRHKPGDLVNELVATVRKFSGSGEFSDDVCLVAVEAVESVVGDVWSKNARQPGGSALRADPEAV